MKPDYRRPMYTALRRRMKEPRRFMQVITGPRQVGKTTLVRQLTEDIDLPVHFVSADEPLLRGREWLAQQWQTARLRAGNAPAVLVIDEVQKVQGWAETVKRFWDEDTHAGRDLKVILLGSAPLLLQQGLSESLAGRFETIHLPHWSYPEIHDAFGWSVDDFIYHGGYPGAAVLIGDFDRWLRYIRDSLIETTISRDVLLLTRVDKPALLRRLFDLACRYSGQILSYTKMLGQLQDAGNTTTLAHYLDLLHSAGMVSGLQKYAGETVRRRGSSPKLLVHNTALLSAQAGLSFEDARADHAHWGRLVESAIGAHLLSASATTNCDIFYWRDGRAEVDFIVTTPRRLIAIEVKSSRYSGTSSGMERFAKDFRPDRLLLVGAEGVPVEDFLRMPFDEWM
ncbi:MAG: ATP-binding protein [Bacteroidetes bacterium]|nr:ATP-binding protein [Bacteroidota bacterium]